MKGSSLVSKSHSLICPLCEVGRLRTVGHHGGRCRSCAGFMKGDMLEALRQITALPDTLGRHACECGHPEMRRLPDGTFHCPACGSEVIPADNPLSLLESDEHSEAYWVGWVDGYFGGSGSFVHNQNLARWVVPSDRLDYYQGHRAGSEMRWDRSAPAARARKVKP